MSNYFANRVTVDGLAFASQAEAARYRELLLMERAGEIVNLMVHPRWELAPSVRIAGENKARPALRYTGDFAYTDRQGRFIVEDVKASNGHMTAAARIRQHLMKAVHGIDVEIVTTGRRR